MYFILKKISVKLIARWCNIEYYNNIKNLIISSKTIEKLYLIQWRETEGKEWW